MLTLKKCLSLTQNGGHASESVEIVRACIGLDSPTAAGWVATYGNPLIDLAAAINFAEQLGMSPHVAMEESAVSLSGKPDWVLSDAARSIVGFVIQQLLSRQAGSFGI